VTRASDSEREAIVARLREAAGEGRLTVEELTERIDAAYAATSRDELEPLTADLPAVAAPSMSVEGGGGGTRFLLGIFGGGDRRGRWRVAERVVVLNVFGGADLDLREATLASPEVRITVISLFGGSDIIVPEGVHAELSSFALFGGDDLKLEGPEPPPGAPVIHVRTVSIFGGTDVKTSRGRRRRGLPPLPPPPPPPPHP
jgi:Domain of unknown function (DUF1707)/Cell wall-active antibiotics response 4TMS YvqF